ncbi:hypothetical protein BDR07DRAFT_1452441 [Suillus spraguei]|nr:hypothetical protein BDR07DRAFT_1452441 [Suillus spraguei]
MDSDSDHRGAYYFWHPVLDGTPCNINGNNLAPGQTLPSPNSPDPDVPPWKLAEHTVWFRDPCELVQNQLSNPDFADQIDYAPRQVFGDKADDLDCHGAMFVPIILGSDKTTISFLKFCQHLFHTSLAAILEAFCPAMEMPEVMMCPDGHYHQMVYGLNLYIADYPEQCLLACIAQEWCPSDLDSGQGSQWSHVHTQALMDAFSRHELWKEWGIIDGIMPFTAYFPQADIHKLITPDILHQIIEGTFKDHIAQAEVIWADIDRW